MRRSNDSSEAGFGLVELIIAMFLLALITVAILPALFNGLRYSSQQSTTATATRELNSLVEQARQSPSCATLAAVAATQSFIDGASRTYTTSGSVGSCTSGATAALTLTAQQSGRTLGTVSALVYIP